MVSAPHEICGTVCGVFSLLLKVTHSVGKISIKRVNEQDVSWTVPVLGGFLDTTHALPGSLPGFVYLN